MKGALKVPRQGFCFRFVGEGLGDGVLMRVVISNPQEVIAVQEASVPNMSWLGNLTDFWKNFVFIVGPAPSYHRGSNNC